MVTDLSVLSDTSTDEGVLQRVAHEVGVGAETEFAEDPRPVRADGFRADAGHRGDLLVALAGAEQAEHLVLANGQAVAGTTDVAGGELGGNPLGERRRHVRPARMHLANGGHELRAGPRLVDVARRPGLQRAQRHVALGVDADDEHAQGGVLRPQAGEQRQKPGAGHRDVQDHHVGGCGGKARQQVMAVDGLAHDPDVRLLDHQLMDARPDQRVVVGNDEADHPALAVGVPRSTGMNTRTVVPRPGSPWTATRPCQVRARSRMPRIPSVPVAFSSAAVIPRPSSETTSSNAVGRTWSRISTCLACAWRATFVRASCKMRNTAVAWPLSRPGSAPVMRTAQVISVRRLNSSASHWIAAGRPRSSRTPGRSSARMRCSASIVASITPSIPCSLRRTGMPRGGTFFANHARSIFSAVRAWPTSS